MSLQKIIFWEKRKDLKISNPLPISGANLFLSIKVIYTLSYRVWRQVVRWGGTDVWHLTSVSRQSWRQAWHQVIFFFFMAGVHVFWGKKRGEKNGKQVLLCIQYVTCHWTCDWSLACEEEEEHADTYTYILMWYIQIYIQIYIHTYLYVYIYTYIDTHIYLYILLNTVSIY
jgi:hypothetical protein